MLTFDNRFVQHLPADLEEKNYVRQVYDSCYSFVEPIKTSKPRTLCANVEFARQLGFDDDFIQSQGFADTFSGNTQLAGMQPYAMCYGGHQFGNWAGQLGDGRAINLGELKTAAIGHQTLQLKGAGMTPYSRHADGLAVLRSSLREYLCSEAMYHLGIPTTRALSLILTGDQVERDMFYDGNPEFEPGAVVCRVSPSFIRFGSFEIFSARNDITTLKRLMDFCIQHDYSHLDQQSDNKYLTWFKEIVSLSLDMVVHWQRVGFVHGVMNTDNMSILGLTIDYGPYGWLDDYDPQWTPNTTDLPGRRYCFANQPKIVHWNLFQLAQSLVPVIQNTDALQDILNDFPTQYEQRYIDMMNQKLGLESADREFIQTLEKLLTDEEIDMTLFFRSLADWPAQNAELDQVMAFFKPGFYQSTLASDYQLQFKAWIKEYNLLIEIEKRDVEERKAQMNRVNPWFVLRNYLSQQAIDQVSQGDETMLNELTQALKTPYVENEKYQKYVEKRPEWARHKAGCSMLSCSS